MNPVSQSDMLAIAENCFGGPHIRAVAIDDDDLSSVVKVGGVVLIDTADFEPREGYALLDLDGIKLWRMQKTSDGWIARTDSDRRPRRVLSRRELNNAWLGVAVRVFSPMA